MNFLSTRWRQFIISAWHRIQRRDERKRYYAYLKATGKQDTFEQWLNIKKYVAIDMQMLHLDLSIFPDNIEKITVTGGVIKTIDIDVPLTKLKTLLVMNCPVEDIRGVINLPMLRQLLVPYTKLERLDTLSLPVSMRFLDLSGTPLTELGDFPNGFTCKTVMLNEMHVRDIRSLVPVAIGHLDLRESIGNIDLIFPNAEIVRRDRTVSISLD